MPTDEMTFISTVLSFKAHYAEGANDFQKSTVRRDRATALATVLPTRSADGWIGTVSAMRTTSDGDGILEIHPLGQESITIESGISLLGNNTLIRPGSQLYQQVSHLSVGAKVIFSGRFESSDLDYLKEGSLTEPGAMDEPEFIFGFTDVKPVSEQQ
ncbi:MAG TPA: hypothetical protein VH640_11375 [Bryobacteraceae bacterium]